MEFRQLRYFVEVARTLNFTRAAGLLRVAQPALSRQIRDLEEELGVKLLDRDQRHVSLTPGGQAFLQQARTLLEQSRNAVELARSHGRPVDRLSIGYVWGLFHTLAPALIHRFRAENPGVAVHLLDMSATEQAKALKQGRIDAGFIGFAHEADAAHLAKERVGSSRFLAVLPCAHPQARRKRVSLDALKADFFLAIAEEAFPGAYVEMLAACRRAGFKPRVVQTAERGHTLLGLVSAGCGVALLPEPLRALPHGGVVFREIEGARESPLYLAYSAHPKAPLLARFVKTCAGPASRPTPREV